METSECAKTESGCEYGHPLGFYYPEDMFYIDVVSFDEEGFTIAYSQKFAEQYEGLTVAVMEE